MAGNGQVQIGQVIGFVTYISFILTATLMASMIFIMLPRAEVSVTRIEEILNSESEIQEAIFCGLWRVRRRHGEQLLEDKLEAGAGGACIEGHFLLRTAG